MILLIDAFNLIYKIDGLEEAMFRSRLELAMQGLIKEFQKYDKKTKQKHEIHIFFDGKKKHGDSTKRTRQGRLFLYYSHDLSADHLIRKFIETSPSPGNIRVVSSDKEVRHHAKRHKCHLYSSEEFATILGEDKKPQDGGADILPDEKTRPLDSDEIAYWEKLFEKKTS